MKSRDLQPRLLYPAKIAFRSKGQKKSFPDKKKLKEFIITKPSLYERDLFKKKKIKTMNNKMAKVQICGGWMKRQGDKEAQIGGYRVATGM